MKLSMARGPKTSRQRGWFLLGASALMLMGCSEQYRIAETGRDPREVSAMLDELRSGASLQASSAQDLNSFFDVLAQPGAVVYFTEAPNPNLGPIESVFSFVDFSFLAPGFVDATPESFSELRAYFVYQSPAVGGPNCGLLVQATPVGSTNSALFAYSCFEVGFDSNDEFLAVLTRDNQKTMTLRTFDATDLGELKGAIQLRMGLFDAVGRETWVGQFSILVGYQF